MLRDWLAGRFNLSSAHGSKPFFNSLLERRMTTHPPPTPAIAASRVSIGGWRRENMLRCISTAFETFERDLLDALARRGFGNIRRVQLPLFRNLGRDGTRLTELAPRGVITKQSMKELVGRSRPPRRAWLKSSAANRSSGSAKRLCAMRGTNRRWTRRKGKRIGVV